jgi:phage gp29-like protein
MDALENLMQDGSMVIPITDNVEAINPATNVNVEIYDKLIEKCNIEISKALLSQTLTTEIGHTGSFAASQTHKKIKDEITNSDKIMLEEAIYKLFKWVTYFNFNNIKVPYVSFYQQEDVNKPLADFVDVLTKNNQIRFTKQFYINRFNFGADEFELIDSSQQPPAFTEDKQEFEKTNVDATPWDQILIDSFGDKLVSDNSTIFNDAIDKIKKFLNSHTSYEDAINQITELFGDMNSDKLEESLTKILFIADVIGRLSVQEEIKDARTN